MVNNPDEAPKAGDRIGDRYEVSRVLGTGGMGVVVAAKHLQLGHQVAIKMLQRTAIREGEAVGRFLREGRAASALTSDHAVRMLDFGQTPDGQPYLVMEFLQGKDLGELLEARGPLPLGEVARLLIQACDALAEAHRHGIVHRDLKPSNLFLLDRGGGQAPSIKVLDFGISKFTEGEDVDQSLTGTRTTLGTPLYMSPEQVRSSKHVDFRSDIWSLGVLLQELLTNQPPFQAQSFSGLCAAIIADPPTPLRQAWPDAPPEIATLVERCLEKDPARRLGSVTEFAEALAPFADVSTLIPRVSAGRIPAASPSRPTDPTVSASVSTVTPSVLFSPSVASSTVSPSTLPAPGSGPASIGVASTERAPEKIHQTFNGITSPGSEPPRLRGLAVVMIAAAVGVLGLSIAVAVFSRNSGPAAASGGPSATPAATSATPAATTAPAATSAAPAASARPETSAPLPVVSVASDPAASASAVPAASVAPVVAPPGVKAPGKAVPAVTKPTGKGYSPTNDDRK